MRTSPAGSAIYGLVLGFAGALPAMACGICIEDRVAAVYDQPAVDRAVARHQQVAFFSLNGSLEATPATRRAVVLALERRGIPGTVRVSLESASASVTFNPKVASLDSLVSAGNLALSARALKLQALRVIGPDGKLQEP